MKIVRVEAWSVAMRLAEPYSVAYESIIAAQNVFLRIVTDQALVGLGCAAPDLHVTGETCSGVLEDLKLTAEPLLVGADPMRIAYLLHQLRDVVPEKPALLAAIDMALYDLLGKQANLPLWKLLGGYRSSMTTCITIGIHSEAETVQRSERFVAEGFRSLKIKGGRDVEADAARVLKVREAVGPGIELRFDGNQGFRPDEALKFIRLVEAADLELFEQPTARAAPELLGRVRREAPMPLPVMADESLMNLRDAYHLARGELADMVNIKLMKVGGIEEALHINSVAKAANLDVMVGCMDESEMGIAAGLHLALARPHIAYADLDGHLDLRDDPAAGALTLKQGQLYPNDLPGLGVVLNDNM